MGHTNKWIPIQCLDEVFFTNALLCVMSNKFMKVVELVVMQIMGTVEDERTFNNLTSMKTNSTIIFVKIWTLLSTCMPNHFIIYNFPYHIWCNHGLDCKQTKEGMLVWSTMYHLRPILNETSCYFEQVKLAQMFWWQHSQHCIQAILFMTTL